MGTLSCRSKSWSRRAMESGREMTGVLMRASGGMGIVEISEVGLGKFIDNIWESEWDNDNDSTSTCNRFRFFDRWGGSTCFSG